MARTYTTQQRFDAGDSGAFDVSKNAGTVAGTVLAGSGACLALGVGVTVLPAPVLGLAATGGALLAAGNWDEITSHFGGDSGDTTTETPVSEPVAKQQEDTTEPSVVEVVKN